MKWDVFISHASEDKERVALPLAEELKRADLKVWYDKFELRIGDSLRESIDEGLRESRWGVVILSPSFFLRAWPKNELNGLAQREADGRKVILPVWHEVTDHQVRQQSPILADRIAAHSTDGIASVAAEIVERVKGSPQQDASSETAVSRPQRRAQSDSSVLLMTDSGYLLVESTRIEISEGLELEVVPSNPQESAFLTELRSGLGRGPIGAAFKLRAFSGHLTNASQIVESGQEVWKLSLTPDESKHRAPSWRCHL